jgi:tetratricopeptide (TPR) repeat protein
VFDLDRLDRRGEAHQCALLGRAALARAGGDRLVESRIDENEALLLEGEARYDEAARLQEQSIAETQALLGPDSWEIGTSLINLGVIYSNGGKPDQAIDCYQRALEIYRKSIGLDHPLAANAFSALASVLNAKGDARGALDAYEKSIAIKSAALGPEHPETAFTLNNMGDVLLRLGQLDRAKSVIERAYAIKLKTYGPDHSSMAFAEASLGNLYVKLGDLDEALAHAQRALTIDEHGYGDDHPRVAEDRFHVADVLIARHAYGSAIALAERALAILESHKAPAPQLPAAQFSLARALWGANRDRARAHSLATTALAKTTDASDHTEIEAWLAQHH